MPALDNEVEPLVRRGLLPQALCHVDAALARNGGDGHALALRGAVLLEWRRYREALDSLHAAAAAGEAGVGLWSQQGWAYYLRGDIAVAVDLHARAVDLAPFDVDARFGHGVALMAAGRFDAALTALRVVESEAPAYPDGALNLAQCLHLMGDQIAAERAAATLTERAPGDPRSWALLGAIRGALGREAACLAAFARARQLERAAGIDGGSLRPYVANLLDFARAGEACSACEEGLRHSPQLAVHGTYAFALLTSGRLAEGWAQYEHRWMQEPMRSLRPKFALPPWMGQPLAGKTILLRSEQGFGDIVQFARYSAVLRARGAKVVLQVHDGFGTIARGFVEVDRVIAKGEPFTEFDCWTHLMSLPRVLGSEAGFDVRFPYLLPESGRASEWIARLDSTKRLRVGIVWAGNPEHRRDGARSMPLERLRSVFDDASVQFVSLQKVLRAGDDAILGQLPALLDAGPQLADFADTAALIAHLDLVICVDTAVAHVAGAMRKPVWVMLPFSADFRWLEDRRDTPWYPSMRLFRQSAPGNWDGVADAVRTELAVFDPGRAAAQGPIARDFAERANDGPFPQVVETDVGIMQVVPARGVMSESLLHYGSYCPDRRELLSRLLPRDAWAVQVGPGVGAETLWLCSVLTDDGHVFCYEDDAFLAQVLQNNLEANGLEHRVSVPRGTLAGPQAPGQDEATQASTHTIDDLRLTRLDLIVIDEASRCLDLLGGADAALWSLRPVVLAACGAGTNDATSGRANDAVNGTVSGAVSGTVNEEAAVVRLMLEHGYRCWRMRTSLFPQPNFFRRSDDIFAGRSLSAILAVPEESQRVVDVPPRLIETSF